jgi:hypothetical protein
MLYITQYKILNYKSMIVHTFHQRSSLNSTLHFSLPSTFIRFMITLQIPSLHFTVLHFTYNYFPNPLFKKYDLQGKVASTSARSWFQCLVVLFTKECFPID